MYRIDSAFFTKVEPINTRKYNKKPVSTPVESENEEEEALPNPILNFFFLSYFFAVGSKYCENKSFHSPSARQDWVRE